MNRMLLSAAWFNWIVVAVFVGASDWTLMLLRLEPSPSTLLFMHFFCVLVFFFGYSYYRAATDFSSNANSIKLGAMAKLSLALVCAIDVALGLVSWPILVPLFVDLIYGLLFLSALSRLPKPVQLGE